MPAHVNLSPVDWLIMLVYFGFVLGIGFILRRRMQTSNEFLMAGRSLPVWVTAFAFISANLGAQEVIGMGASGAKYGISTAHFYWIGAIPAMVFVGVFMMPFYYGSRARSVPEYLRLRFDEKTRTFNAVSFAVMTVFSSGISMYAMAQLLQTLHVFDPIFGVLHLPLRFIFDVSIGVSALTVLLYILAGGLRSAIYNEVLQFCLICAGFIPLVFLGLRAVGGWNGLRHTLSPAYMHAWAGMDNPSHNLLGVDAFGLVMGLGFVLSFGYWCTDYLVVQRAMAADNLRDARLTPLVAAIPKMIFPFLVILPGIIAAAIPHLLPDHDYNMAVPALLLRYFPSGMLGLGLTALLASFMSGMAGNVTAFNTVWTYDIYQAHVRPNATDEHYLRVGRITTVVGIAASVFAAYLAAQFNNIMDVLQLVFAFVNAPLFATFLLGMFWKRTTGHGAFTGLIAGTVAAAIHHGLTLPAGETAGIKGGWIAVMHAYPSEMGQNFYTAIAAWTTCFAVTIIVSLLTKPRDERELAGLVHSLTPRPAQPAPWYARPAVLGGGVLAGCIVLNLIFR
jgi:SSS family solute:Na+ symporter